MFTAKDMYEAIKVERICVGIDEWLSTALKATFINTEGRPIIVCSDTLRRNNWHGSTFIREMEKRGFSAVFTSSQRDGDFYTISFPPQGR